MPGRDRTFWMTWDSPQTAAVNLQISSTPTAHLNPPLALHIVRPFLCLRRSVFATLLRDFSAGSLKGLDFRSFQQLVDDARQMVSHRRPRTIGISALQRVDHPGVLVNSRLDTHGSDLVTQQLVLR